MPSLPKHRATGQFTARKQAISSFSIDMNLLNRGPVLHIEGKGDGDDHQAVVLAQPKIFTPRDIVVDPHSIVPVLSWPVQSTSTAIDELKRCVNVAGATDVSTRARAHAHRLQLATELKVLEHKVEMLETAFDNAESLDLRAHLADKWSTAIASMLKQASECSLLPIEPRVSLTAKVATERHPFARHLNDLAVGPVSEALDRHTATIDDMGDTLGVADEWALASNMKDLRHYMARLQRSKSHEVERETNKLEDISTETRCPPAGTTSSTRRLAGWS